MKCPECDGHGGGKDYFGEWDDCAACDGEGQTTPERHANWVAELAQIDAEIDRLMTTSCEKCGVVIGDCVCGAHWSTVQ